MKVHFIQHEIFEAPAAFLTWAKARNYTITISKVFDYQPLPKTVDCIDLLIVMGGPQSPASTKSEFPYYDAEAEIELIQKCIDAGKAVVGICLGAQLLGEAMGFSYEHSPEKEIGVFPIQLTEFGLMDEKINHFGPSIMVGHWHSDMPGITPECKVLATSQGCPNQIISYSNLVYGFQCHLELNSEAVACLIENESTFSKDFSAYPFVQDPDQIMQYDFTDMNEQLFIFLDKLVKEYMA